MSSAPNKFYVTTPIYYVNARPHIGHAYTTIVADVLARRHRLLGEDTLFLTGTDEHGQKIERSALAAGVPPQQFADEVAASFEGLWKRMGITNDLFIRTTSEAHKRGVQQLFTALYERGFIYLASYTGAYCVSDEAFVDVPVGAPCPDCGRITEEVTEENFFFKLSAFQRPLLDLIESGTLEVEPEARRNEVLSFLRGDVVGSVWHGEKLSFDELESLIKSAPESDKLGRTARKNAYVPGALKDLSISRSSFTWGVPVPELALKHSGAKDKHVIYVWLDALANYMTAVGYGDPSHEGQATFKKWWPADLHLVGKEIIRFHCVYWPAFLLALDRDLQHNSEEAPPVLEPAKYAEWAAEWLPKAITAHGWLLFDNSKMSKSKGNIVRTETILDAFGQLCPQLPIAPLGLSFRSEAEDSASSASQAETRPPTPHERDLFAADVLRYFLLREIPFGQDGSFSFEAMVTRYNADLANGYGNLVSRTLNMIALYFESKIPLSLKRKSEPWPFINLYLPVAQQQVLAGETGFALQNAANLTEVTAKIVSLIAGTDQEISLAAPWKLGKDQSAESQAKLSSVLYGAAESIRIITALLYPILPFATARVWAQLGLGDIEAAARNGELNNLQWGGLKPGTKLGPLAPIFPRADKALAETMSNMEQNYASSNTPKATRDLTAVNAHHDAGSPDTSPFPEAPLSSASASTPKPSRTMVPPSHPADAFKAAVTPTPAVAVPTSSTDPAAPPRAVDPLDEPAGVLPVAGSLADKPTLPSTPGPATEAPASGAFAGAGSQIPIDAQPSDASPQITIDDFAKVELRVAQIIVAERIPKADKLLRLEVDLGYEKRQILSGIAEWYSPEDLLGRRIVVITNLAPRKMRGLESHGMLLAASNGDNGKPVLATFGEEIALGSRLK